MDKDKVENKRNYYRVCLEKPLCGGFKIVKCNGRSLSTRLIKACITDIGPGGLSFTTKLSLPVDDNVIFQFNVKVDDENIFFRGEIIWKREIGELPIYKYGVNFVMDEVERTSAIKVFNKLSLYVKRGCEDKYCYICKENSFPCT